MDLRKSMKRAKNPMQVIIKLIMNASYGRCGMKPSTTKVEYRKQTAAKLMDLYYHRVKSCTKINGNVSNEIHRLELYNEVEKHKNMIHISTEILSMSKRIMKTR